MKKNVLLYAITALLLFKNCTPAKAPATGPDCTYNGITRDELVEMIRTYKNGQLNHINNGMRAAIDDMNRENNVHDPERPSGFEDARTIFFKLDTLQQFFDAVKCKVEKNGLQRANGTPILPSDIGVRIYYTAYPGLVGKKGKAVNEETKKGRHTLVFVATYYDKDSTNIDFDPTVFDETSKVPLRLDNPKFSLFNNSYFALFSGHADPAPPAELSEDAARNHGELCPPPKDCGTDLTKMADALRTPRQ